ncbi:MAG: MMPL family transporter [Acidimicrobiia bacterium]
MGFLERLGRFSARHHWIVIAVWIVVVAGTVAANAVAGGETSNSFSLPGTESQEATDLLEKEFPDAAGSQATIVFKATQGASVTAQQSQVEAALAEAAKLPDVASDGVSNPFLPAPYSTVSTKDDSIAYASVSYTKSTSELGLDAAKELEKKVGKFRTDALEIQFGGDLIVNTEPIDTGVSEEVGLLAAIVVLLIALGAVAAMGLPIIAAIVGVGSGLAAIGLLSNVLTVPSVAPAGAIMIGLGVGIDYSLFIVARYRGALSDGLPPVEAAGKTTATSGRAVVTAGSTVIVALLGLLVFEVPAVSTIAYSIAIVVVISIVAAVTLLPAVLGLVGRHVDWGRIPFLDRAGREPGGRRWATLVTRVPLASLAAGLAVLVVIAIPMFGLELGPSDATDAPNDSTEHEAYDLVSEGFGPGYSNPFLMVAELTGDQSADETTLGNLLTTLQGVDGVAAVNPPSVVPQMFNSSMNTAVFQLIATTDVKNEKTPELIDHLRDDVIPKATDGTGLSVLVGGTSAAYVDLDTRITDRLIVFIGLVILISFVILGTVFRSVAIPIKAGLFNLLVIGAAYGVLVMVFQWGWGLSALGIDRETPIISYLAPIIFAVLFGLSMDYEVYSVSRIEEEYSGGDDPHVAVVDGLGAAARMVVAAASIMFFVFAAFVINDNVILKMFGLGLAVAILLDAFVARMVLLPAVLRLLGRAAWWPGKRRAS